MPLRGNCRAVVYNSAAVPANGIACVALFCAGRLLFAACICAGGIKIVVMRVDLTVFNTAGMAPCPFMAVGRGRNGVLAYTAAHRADAVIPLVVFIRVFRFAAAAPFAVVARVVMPVFLIPYVCCVIGVCIRVKLAVFIAANLADR